VEQALVVPRAEVEVSRSTAAWSVTGDGWKQVLPDLPDDVIVLLATPVVVSAERVAPVARAVPPQAGSLAGQLAACAPQFLAPAPPKRIRPRHRRHP
jgi:hypothetical protein